MQVRIVGSVLGLTETLPYFSATVEIKPAILLFYSFIYCGVYAKMRLLMISGELPVRIDKGGAECLR